MSAVLQTLTRPHAAPSLAAPSMSTASLRVLFNAARSSGKRAKEAAESLGLSEGEAIAAHAGSHDYGLKATPMQGPWVELLQALQLCGPLMALTRNASTVHEKTGIYENINATGHMGLALGEEIDLRLFFSRWHAGFAVIEPANGSKNLPAQSLQFFDAHGVAVH
ncbi:MAG: ChuX/HutX family heme-like substrate-binding protein, partial [Polaromonas sp.]